MKKQDVGDCLRTKEAGQDGKNVREGFSWITGGYIVSEYFKFLSERGTQMILGSPNLRKNFWGKLYVTGRESKNYCLSTIVTIRIMDLR